MTTEFVKLEMKNNPATTAELTGYRDVICEYGEKGYSYAGFVPVKSGPSGKLRKLNWYFRSKIKHNP